ncbi:MAG TPA: nucleoside monophosphate kinase [Candidatus Pacearchaeota archaeon]|nr:nucleoside monophosphate kinase [Candidatus Pacearchaeota archaeon]
MPLRKILFVGMPGAGKGRQADLLIHHNFKQISTGDLIREALERKDPLVMVYKSSIEKGGFLPDKEVFELIDKEIKGLGEVEGYVLDGAIRNKSQAEIALKEGLIEEVLFFDLNKEEAIERISKRKESGGRKDDSSEVVIKRIEKYKRETEPIVNYLKEKKIPVYRIDASPSIEQIHKEVIRVLKLNE